MEEALLRLFTVVLARACALGWPIADPSFFVLEKRIKKRGRIRGFYLILSKDKEVKGKGCGKPQCWNKS
jgi:hypothetical protein